MTDATPVLGVTRHCAGFGSARPCIDGAANAVDSFCQVVLLPLGSELSSGCVEHHFALGCVLLLWLWNRRDERDTAA